jgi:hypothetical protein
MDDGLTHKKVKKRPLAIGAVQKMTMIEPVS